EPLASGCDPCVTQVCGGDDYCCNVAWDQNCIAEAEASCPTVNCSGPCSADTCPYGCCDANGKCQPSSCQFWGVPCGGNPIPGGSTCADCYDGACETCDTQSCHA